MRSRRLSKERKRLLLRAAAVLTASSTAVAVLPFRRAIRFGSVQLGSPNASSVEDLAWAVQAVSRRLPWRTVCIQRGLAVQRMLRAAGIDAILHYGARQSSGNGKLEAHVWVSVHGRTVIGGEEAPQFALLASYP